MNSSSECGLSCLVTREHREKSQETRVWLGGGVKRRGLSATYPARAHARPQQALLRVVQADPARLFIWCFADGDARTSNQSAARADSRTIGERIYRERRLGCRRGGRGGWIGSSGRLEGSRALAARPTRRGYDVPPGSATRASDLVRRGSVPDTIAPYRLAWKGARSNGVRANSRCDAGRRASPGSARVRRARRGVGHASVRVDAGDTRETRERRRAVREGRARVWVCAYDQGSTVTRHFMCTPEISNALYRVFKTDDPYAGGIRRTRSLMPELARGFSFFSFFSDSSVEKARGGWNSPLSDGAPTPRRRAGGRLPRLDARVPLRSEAPARQKHGRHARDRGARFP